MNTPDLLKEISPMWNRYLENLEESDYIELNPEEGLNLSMFRYCIVGEAHTNQYGHIGKDSWYDCDKCKGMSIRIHDACEYDQYIGDRLQDFCDHFESEHMNGGDSE